MQRIRVKYYALWKEYVWSTSGLSTSVCITSTECLCLECFWNYVGYVGLLSEYVLIGEMCDIYLAYVMVMCGIILDCFGGICKEYMWSRHVAPPQYPRMEQSSKECNPHFTFLQ